jgi:hypothetical protein
VEKSGREIEAGVFVKEKSGWIAWRCGLVFLSWKLMAARGIVFCGFRTWID